MPEMSLEEQALRHADEFFTGESKWIQNHNGDGNHLCVGMALLRGAGVYNCLKWREATPQKEAVAGKALGLSFPYPIIVWNDTCPDFTTMKAHLRARIEYYTKQRLSQTYLVIIGPGRQVRV